MKVCTIISGKYGPGPTLTVSDMIEMLNDELEVSQADDKFYLVLNDMTPQALAALPEWKGWNYRESCSL